uniref:BHLH domain-containing protein n=1 Tax=Anabas testudineus TaxID=64144 RepID=A0A7N6A0P7_ANATE
MSMRQKYRRPPASIKQEQDDDSDAEETHLGLRRADGVESQIIHSGHFMVSSPHSEHPPKKGYDFDTVNKQTCQTYHFGKASTSHFSIDASLTKLFECMTLAYSGKLVSPKWKNFKGLKLLWRDKIRLNNAIWRAWYMQYVEKRENPVCHFVTPLDGNMDMDVHRPAEATEGKCWKRRIEIVIREYHKWRTYFKKRLQKHKDDDLSSLLKFSLFGEVSPDMLRLSFYQDEETAARRVPRKHNETPAPMEMDPLFDMDVLMSEFSDTLFSTLASHQPISWPNPREIAHAGNADMIQPGLIPLQPNLDFMDSFDPLQGSSKAPAIAAVVLKCLCNVSTPVQKRRSNINIGFKTLCNLVPTLKSQSNISNAVTLQKTVEHIGKLQQERQQLQEEVKRLREEIEELNTSINLCQEQLPATGVPIRRHRFDHMQEKFNEYVKNRTLQNWKFWIFSIIIKPLFESFNEMVSTTSRAELCQTTLQWLDRHCSLPALRPMVLSTLRQLSTTTSILSDPSLLPEEATQAVRRTDG